jgi:ABC-type phosphate transport system permease subunit
MSGKSNNKNNFLSTNQSGKAIDKIVKFILLGAAMFAVVAIAIIVYSLASESVYFFQK